METKLLVHDIKMLIHKYTELTVDEHLTMTMNKDADKVWNRLTEKLNQLGGV